MVWYNTLLTQRFAYFSYSTQNLNYSEHGAHQYCTTYWHINSTQDIGHLLQPVFYEFLTNLMGSIDFGTSQFSIQMFWRWSGAVWRVLLATLSNDDHDGSENDGKKINLSSFKLNRVYLDPLNKSNAGDFSCSWILTGFIQSQKDGGKFVVVCPRPP